MFNAPIVFTNVPDIAKIYEINDSQIDELESAVTQLDSDIFFETMSEERTARWEKMLGIVPLDNHSLEDRRLKIHINVLEKMPYSYRVLVAKLNALLGNSYSLTLYNNTLGFSCSILDETLFKNVMVMLEDIVPLNMCILITDNRYREITTETYVHTVVVKSVERTISTEE